MNKIITKKCTKCKEEKNIGCFNKNKREKDGFQYWCKECQTIYHRENDKKYYQEKRDEILKQKREYYCNHKEEKSAYGKEYRKKNKEKLKKMYSDWVKKNREHVNAYSKQYAKDNPEPSRNASRRRRARKLNCEGGITQKEWMCVLEKYENKCLCCGISENIEMDHVIPLSKRGMHTVDNVQPLCRSCNARKRDKVEDYR